MSRGIYAATSKLINCSSAMNITGNNIANADTCGFKKDKLVSQTFGEYLVYKMGKDGSSQIGGISHGIIENQVATSYQQGVLTATGRSLDLAIEGEGFFNLQTPEGQVRLTRCGQFCLNENGMLADASGNLLLGKNGPLSIGQADFTVSEDGEIMVEGKSAGVLLITCPTDLTALVKEEGTTFSYNAYIDQAGNFQGKVKQGFLESSNVNMIDEMSNMMQYSRSFQTASQIVKMMDKVEERTVNDLASM